ncbi:MAG: glycerophosphodiester phosphodiesterase [Lactobacillaceae bacterium]|nr:glycerophosphodiester phosphodiesterase [Lactobacillaceae bacterium]
MKNIWYQVWTSFWKHKWTFGRVFFSISAIIGIVIVPLFRIISGLAQRADDLPFLALSNFGSTLIENPIFTSALVVIILMVLLFFVIQLLSYAGSFKAIVEGQKPTTFGAFRFAFNRVRKIGISGNFLVLLYGLIVLPFPMLTFHSQLTNYLKIPAFVLPTILSTPWMITSLTILGVIALYFAIRLFYVLPELSLNTNSSKIAIHNSWAKTRGKNGWALLIRLGLGSLIIGALTLIGFGLTWGVQFLADKYVPGDYTILVAFFTFTFATLINLFNSLVAVHFILNLMSEDYSAVSLTDFKSKRFVIRFIVSTTLIVSLLIQGLEPSVVFVLNTANRHLNSYSHRGVDNGNGVQNTIPALQVTVKKAHPDYVEMDIRQTKDGKWAVMHDPNLSTLTKGASNKGISDLTLAQATSLTVYENGHSAKIPSFADYAAEAKKLGVKLLVEIKTERTNASDLADSFLKQFKSLMTEQNWDMHSLNYSVVQRLKTLDTKMKVGMILPGNFLGEPVTKADFYTMEYSFLNRQQVENLHERGKRVLAWTVDDSDAMVSTYAQGVNGEITDDISTLQSVLKDTNAAQLMHQKLGVYIVNVLGD